MSFHVYLQKFIVRKPAQASREQVLAVLKATNFSGPDKFGFYVVEFPDGDDVEFSAKGLQGSGDFTGCAFHIHSMGPHLVRFIFETARAGDMVMLPAMEDFVPILSLPGQRNELPVELVENNPPPVLCGSPDELESLLTGGYVGWQKYRDKVLRDGREV